MNFGKFGGFYVTFVRHGETDLNKNKMIQGQGVDAVLNETGREQARALGNHIREEVYTHVYSSDLKRAKETCEILLSQNLEAQNRSDCIVFDKRIRERNYGEVEGCAREYYYEMVKKGKTNPDGAETIREVATRSVDFFNDLCEVAYNFNKSNSVPNVLVVAHGRLLVTLVTEFSEKFGCVFPSGKLGVVGMNTSRSCFSVLFTKNFELVNNENQHAKRVQMHCTMLNNSDHLDGN